MVRERKRERPLPSPVFEEHIPSSPIGKAVVVLRTLRFSPPIAHAGIRGQVRRMDGTVVELLIRVKEVSSTVPCSHAEAMQLLVLLLHPSWTIFSSLTPPPTLMLTVPCEEQKAFRCLSLRRNDDEERKVSVVLCVEFFHTTVPHRKLEIPFFAHRITGKNLWKSCSTSPSCFVECFRPTH